MAAPSTEEDVLAAALAGQATTAGLLPQQAATKGRKRSVLLVAMATVVILVLAGAALWYYEKYGKKSPPSGATKSCKPECTGGLVCVDGKCKRNALSCAKDSDCGTCNKCINGTCMPRDQCCGGVTCAKGQQCYPSDNSCRYMPGYCDGKQATCPANSQCDLVSNTCIEQPAYGPDSGKGCFEGFGSWVWELDESTGSGAWRCRCTNSAMYDTKNECSPLLTATLCSPSNTDPASLVPASQVPAFKSYGWGDAQTLIDAATKSSAQPSPVAGACPCRPGWAGGSCTHDITCSGGGSYSPSAGCQCYRCTYTEPDVPTIAAMTYEYEFSGPNCGQVTNCSVNGATMSCDKACNFFKGKLPGCVRPSPGHPVPGLVCTALVSSAAPPPNQPQ